MDICLFVPGNLSKWRIGLVTLERNPAPLKTEVVCPIFTRFHPSQLVQESIHPQQWLEGSRFQELGGHGRVLFFEELSPEDDGFPFLCSL